MTGLVLLSGGLDSSTLLFDRLATGETIEALFINYGQSMATFEERAASAICGASGVPLHKLSVPLPKEYGAGWLIDPPDTPEWTDHKVTHWPHRNVLLITLAAMLANQLGATNLYVGFMDIEAEPFPDSTPEFLKSLEPVLQLTDPSLRIVAPFIVWTKRAVAVRALQLGVPVELTFSCTYASDHHCCSCPSCIDRIDALEYAKSLIGES